MKSRFLALPILLLILTSSWSSGQASSMRIWREVLGGGAIHATTSNHALRGTIGQSVSAWVTTVNHQHGAGFWYSQARRVATAVEDGPGQLGFSYRLDQNSPNPFNPRTTIRFSLAATGPVRLDVYDLRGRHVSTLIDREYAAGEHEFVFHATDLASGIYIYRLHAGEFIQSRRITLIK